MTAVEAGSGLGTWQGLGELRLCGRMALIPLLFFGGVMLELNARALQMLGL